MVGWGTDRPIPCLISFRSHLQQVQVSTHTISQAVEDGGEGRKVVASNHTRQTTHTHTRIQSEWVFSCPMCYQSQTLFHPPKYLFLYLEKFIKPFAENKENPPHSTPGNGYTQKRVCQQRETKGSHGNHQTLELAQVKNLRSAEDSTYIIIF